MPTISTTACLNICLQIRGRFEIVKCSNLIWLERWFPIPKVLEEIFELCIRNDRMRQQMPFIA